MISMVSSKMKKLASGHYSLELGTSGFCHETKLKPGDQFRVIGAPLLTGFDNGAVFNVESIVDTNQGWAYMLRKHKARKLIAHKVLSVDDYVHKYNGKSPNRIEII